tara:strand:- start:209 stop:409 length:201 start_codon:yes stop_codon:yes gene_type:complete
MRLWESDMIESIYNNLELYLLTYASIIAGMVLFMIVFTIYDYIKIMTPFWNIEKKYKKELNKVRSQ